MSIEALPTYRPDCHRCGCPMDRHMDEGCWDCNCFAYNYPYEDVAVFCGPKADGLKQFVREGEEQILADDASGGSGVSV